MDPQIGEIEIQIISEASEIVPGYMDAKQRYIVQRNFSNVLAKKFPSNMEEYFRWRKSLKNKNIHQVDAIVPVEGTNECVISYEPVDGKLCDLILSTRLKEGLRTGSRRDQSFRVDLFEDNYDALIVHVTTQIQQVYDDLHSQEIYHGELTYENILYSYNYDYPVDDVRHVDIKLTLPLHEEMAKGVNGGDIVGSVLLDQQELGKVIQQLVSKLKSDRSTEFGNLVMMLGGENVINVYHHYSMWTDCRRGDFLCLMKYKIIRDIDVGDFQLKDWKSKFHDLITIARNACSVRGVVPPEYNNTFGSFVDFTRNTISHFHEYELHDQRQIGPDLKHVIRRFQEFDKALFDKLVPMADGIVEWDSFFKETQ